MEKFAIIIEMTGKFCREIIKGKLKREAHFHNSMKFARVSATIMRREILAFGVNGKLRAAIPEAIEMHATSTL